MAGVAEGVQGAAVTPAHGHHETVRDRLGAVVLDDPHRALDEVGPPLTCRTTRASHSPSAVSCVIFGALLTFSTPRAGAIGANDDHLLGQCPRSASCDEYR